MSGNTPITPNSPTVQSKPRTVTTTFVAVKHSLTPYEFEQVCKIFVRIALRMQEREKQAKQENDTSETDDEKPV